MKFAFGLLLLCISSACVDVRIPHTTPPAQDQTKPAPPSEAKSWMETAGGKECLVVEFDDQGEPYGSLNGQMDQRAAALRRIDDLTKTTQALNIILFVHGWHHSAKTNPLDPNLQSFLGIIDHLNLMENSKASLQAVNSASTEPSPSKWVGIYIGWRGENIPIRGVNVLTFWNRKNAAARVGGLALSHFLNDVGSHLKKDHADGRLYLAVGHSFGGRVLENSISNSIVGQKGRSTIDLVVLLNEASEAAKAKAAMDVLADHVKTEETWVRPQIVSITSDMDTATGFWFPTGQWLPSLKLFFRDYKKYGTQQETALELDQGDLFRFTAGHLEKLWTHVLIKPGAMPDWDQRVGEDVVPFWMKTSKGPHQTPPDYLIVPRKGAYSPKNPYWVFSVHKEVMQNHNDIFGEPVLELIEALLAQREGAASFRLQSIRGFASAQKIQN